MYMGATTLATPIPAPPMSLQTMRISTLGGKAVPTALIAGARKVFVRLMNFCMLELPAGA